MKLKQPETPFISSGQTTADLRHYMNHLPPFPLPHHACLALVEWHSLSPVPSHGFCFCQCLWKQTYTTLILQGWNVQAVSITDNTFYVNLSTALQSVTLLSVGLPMQSVISPACLCRSNSCSPLHYNRQTPKHGTHRWNRVALLL